VVFIFSFTERSFAGLFKELQPAWYDQEQLEQLDELQPAQDEPEPDEDGLNLYPTEKPNEDNFLVGFSAPHAGHFGSSSR